MAASVYDLLIAAAFSHGLWLSATVLLAGFAAVLWPVERRPSWLTPQLRTAVPAMISVLFTAGVLLTDRAEALFGPGEVVILLSLLFIAVRHCPWPSALLCGVLDAVALLLLPGRYFRSLSDALVFIVVGLILIGFTAGSAAYLRSLDYRRTVAVGETRRAERVAIAADLHDFVAHHVTGILVQTRVARMMADRQPQEDLDPVLAGIEHAATEALASMRRTVGVLRDTGPEAADRRPVGDLAGISDLVAGFASPVQKSTLQRDPAVSDDLPHEVQAAAFRVVQEALTNVRRHAADATRVTVRLARSGDRVEVTVTDDGHGGTQLPEAAHGGGFGLVGLTERVTALGGELRAGPRGGPAGEAGAGWQVRAVFPAGKQ
ncbi:sensor histidine kinase [Streptomyces sp. CA-179760]|uniref:sensor histidine kinase n=1 Tax=Streptomyces sp. CA-179760 TaxID=3240054 RepID=UPI003D949F2A